MGRTYAGMLGLVAFATVVLRSVIQGGGIDATIRSACLFMFLFAVIGLLIGHLADATVTDAVLRKFRQQLQAETEAEAANQENT